MKNSGGRCAKPSFEARSHFLSCAFLAAAAQIFPLGLEARAQPAIEAAVNDRQIKAFREEIWAIEGRYADEGADTAQRKALNAELNATYRNYFPEGAIRTAAPTLAPSTLLQLIYAEVDFSTYARDAAHEDDLEAAFSALRVHGKSDKTAVKAMYDYYVTEREFRKAQALRDEFPGFELPALPEILKARSDIRKNERAAYIPSSDGSVLQRSALDLSKGAHVVIVSHPQCHFSQFARDGINRDKALKKALAGHGLWLAPPATPLADAALGAWTREVGRAPVYVAERYSDWPEIDYWGTPSFYFYKDGVLTARMIGWRREEETERLKNLRRHMIEIGLTPG